MLTPKYNIVSFLVLLCTLLSLRTFGQLDNEHYLPPLKQVSNNAAIQQQAIYFSTPETTPFNIKIFRGSNTTEIVTITGLEKGSPKIFDSTTVVADANNSLTNGDNNITLVTNVNTGNVQTDAGLRIIAEGGQKFYVNYRGRSSAQAGSLTSKGSKAKGLESLE